MLLALAGAAFLCAPAPAFAIKVKSEKAKSEKAKSEDASEEAGDKKKDKKGGEKPEQLGSYGDWGAYAASGQAKRPATRSARPRSVSPRPR